VTTELTPAVEGYFVQICRTLVVGEASEAQRRAFGVFRQALEAGIAAVRPGATAADVRAPRTTSSANTGSAITSPAGGPACATVSACSAI
jgi:hypothetical protein